jgi:hypothetical protein
VLAGEWLGLGLARVWTTTRAGMAGALLLVAGVAGEAVLFFVDLGDGIGGISIGFGCVGWSGRWVF